MLREQLSAELPDSTPLREVDLPTQIQRALAFYGIRTVGELRETPEKTLLSFQDLGRRSVAYIRSGLVGGL